MIAIPEIRAADSSRTKPLRVHAVFWNTVGPGSVAYTITELLDNLPDDVDRTLWCFASDPERRRPYIRQLLPELLYRSLCKVNIPAAAQGRVAVHVLLRTIQQGDIVYVWPPYDLGLIRRAKERGAIVIAERISCMGQMVRDALAQAYARRNMPLPPDWCLAADIENERQQMLECDFVTAPNPMVEKGLRDAGISKDRIIESSYGYNPGRLAKAIAPPDLNAHRHSHLSGWGSSGGLDVLLEAGACERRRPTSHRRAYRRRDQSHLLEHISAR